MRRANPASPRPSWLPGLLSHRSRTVLQLGRLRTRLTFERLEDRTLPSGTPYLPPSHFLFSAAPEAEWIGRELGVSAVVQKPFEAAGLMAALTTHCKPPQ